MLILLGNLSQYSRFRQLFVIIVVIMMSSLTLLVPRRCENSRDFIIVRDCPDAYCPVIERYCNTVNGGQVVSSGETLFVQFQSNNRIQRQGFAATFEYIAVDRLRVRTSATPHSGWWLHPTTNTS